LGISEDILEHEAKTLDLQYNDLLNIFLEKDNKFQAQGQGQGQKKYNSSPKENLRK
jgi:hypothetical protein